MHPDDRLRAAIQRMTQRAESLQAVLRSPGRFSPAELEGIFQVALEIASTAVAPRD